MQTGLEEKTNAHKKTFLQMNEISTESLKHLSRDALRQCCRALRLNPGTNGKDQLIEQILNFSPQVASDFNGRYFKDENTHRHNFAIFFSHLNKQPVPLFTPESWDIISTTLQLHRKQHINYAFDKDRDYKSEQEKYNGDMTLYNSKTK